MNGKIMLVVASYKSSHTSEACGTSGTATPSSFIFFIILTPSNFFIQDLPPASGSARPASAPRKRISIRTRLSTRHFPEKASRGSSKFVTLLPTSFHINRPGVLESPLFLSDQFLSSLAQSYADKHGESQYCKESKSSIKPVTTRIQPT